ncbi:hypothetical protein K493DRAFT_310650 [Basidiobolus meristosporus CBS 931.73]|uniref:Homeodomain-like protein n=1 Tax=Basidiobolus meristosporus CBS 931.73 TaxID=1314790 RepID=A0A1Y1Z7S3_9FUNG|nr:hypothetical protein K493DRAFT_310650 [Basidiobolus meristosporus CBS 931.73]|eukprot:ORY06320.1 hypothetical protein K493DRAFT_310650 [Basidiobolus meristosporus CBS 931.73]
MPFTQLSPRHISQLLKLQSIKQIFGRLPIHTLERSEVAQSLKPRVNPQTTRYISCSPYTSISLYSPRQQFSTQRILSSQAKERPFDTKNDPTDSETDAPCTGDSKHSNRALFIPWTEEEIAALKEHAPRYRYNWSEVANHIPERSATACKYYWKKLKMKPYVTGPWTPAEDEILKKLIEEEGTINQWHKFAKVLGRRPRDCLSRVKYIFHTQM